MSNSAYLKAIEEMVANCRKLGKQIEHEKALQVSSVELQTQIRAIETIEELYGIKKL